MKVFIARATWSHVGVRKGAVIQAEDEETATELARSWANSRGVGEFDFFEVTGTRITELA